MAQAKTDTGPRPTDAAIVAIGAIFPGRGDTTGFWRDIVEGVDTLSDVPPTHWLPEDYYDSDPLAPDRTYGRRGAFLSPTAFDPVAFGVPPNALQSTDTSQLLALVAARQVLDVAEADSGGRIDKSRTSVVLGVASATELTAHMAGRLQRPAWIRGLRETGLDEDTVQTAVSRIESNFAEWRESTFPGLLGNVIAGRIANRLDLGGSNYVTDAACASSLSALQIALHELRSGDSDTVLTGGVDTLNDILMFMCFSKTPALSPTGDCRPFSARADGTMLGEGIGMLALRRLEDAERDGNRIHAVIRGLGGGSDGRSTAIYAPLASGQARALTRAYEQAGYSPRTVGLVEAHGTGTIAGDRTELEGLHKVFTLDGETGPSWCALGSVKSQIGHTKAAAGSASLLKIAHALSRKILPPTLKVEQPADALVGATPFYLNTTPRPWIAQEGAPRRASVSSFGFGGSNFHATLEEYRGPNAVLPERVLPSELVLVSADDAGAFRAALERLAALDSPEAALSAEASESHAGYRYGDRFRAAFIVQSMADLREKAARLTALVASGRAGDAPLGKGVFHAEGRSDRGRTAFLFAGQGSQYVGMGAGLAMAFPSARRAWERAASHPLAGPLCLHDLAFPPAPFTDEAARIQAAQLTAVAHAQPAIGAVALAQLAVLADLELVPDMCAGHSYGEIMALHRAGVLDAQAALTVSVERGRLMADAAADSSGGMLAVQANHDAAARIIAAVGSSLVLANDNAPSQVVLSGSDEAVQAAERHCRDAGLRSHRLPVATAFHSAIMSGAVRPFEKALKKVTFADPALPVYANQSGQAHPESGAAIRKALAGQITSTVQFRACLEAMYGDGARTFVEIGPGNVLGGLARDTLGDRGVHVVSLDSRREDDVTAFLSGVAALAVAGHKLNLASLFAEMPPQKRPAPRPAYAVDISGANHDKPYPPRGGAADLPPPNPPAVHVEPMTQSSSTPPQAPDTSVARALQEIAARHGEFLQAMAQAHSTFLNATSAALGVPVAALPTLPAAPVAAPAAAPVMMAPPPGPARTPAPAPSPAPHLNGATHAPRAAPSATAPVDPLALVTALVAEKTGYPSDMLDPDMDLEGELGIDSIKQVEILSGLRERLPGLPEVEPEKLAELRTIRLVAGHVAQALGATVDTRSAPAPAPAALPAKAAPVQSGNGSLVTTDFVRGLIAEKTGYPADMLEDDMDLEGELGIDSIKQVEILSALRERMPHLPEVEPERLAELRSIRKIADFFH